MNVPWRVYAMRTYEDNTAGIDLTTAWTARLPICHAAVVPAAVATLGCHPALSGEYLHELSYLQWGEPAKIDHDPNAGPVSAPSADPDHLAVYYRAPTEAAALEVAGALLAALASTGVMPALCREVVVTHADDWDWDWDATITADMLALVEAGEDEITLPAHWREFHLDHGPA